MMMHQLLGWPLYLINNASGQLGYPVGTNRKTVAVFEVPWLTIRLQPQVTHLPKLQGLADHHV